MDFHEISKNYSLLYHLFPSYIISEISFPLERAKHLGVAKNGFNTNIGVTKYLLSLIFTMFNIFWEIMVCLQFVYCR